MNFSIFSRKTVLTAFLIFCFSITLGVFTPATSEAISIGQIFNAGSAIAQKQQVVKELEYYDNAGRDQWFEELKKSDGVNNDPELNALLDNIMEKLTTAIAKTEPSITEKPYNYFVNPKKTFNAYCSLGHNISVNTGAFAFLPNEEQLAVVVAHELVHGQRNHPINGAKKQLNANLAYTIVAQGLGGNQRIAAAILVQNFKATGITKPGEWEADNVAFGYLITAGYNPGAPASVWQRVMVNSKSASKDVFTDILSPSTHPSAEERRDNYAKKLAEYCKGKVYVASATGEIKVNNKTFMKPVAFANMSGLERAYLIAGNLAKVYHNNQDAQKVHISEGSIMIGHHYIAYPCPEDEDIETLVEKLTQIK